MKAPEILDKAAGHMRDRAATYDKPEGERSMTRVVAAFNAIHGTDLTVEQGWSFMAVLKHVRLFTRPGYDADSCEDMAAYIALMGEEMSGESILAAVEATEKAIKAGTIKPMKLHPGEELVYITRSDQPYVDPYDQPARG